MHTLRLSNPSALQGVSVEEALQTFIGAVQELSLAESHEDVQGIVGSAARRLTGSDGATLVLRDGGECFYADEDAIEPLWKGERFPLEDCISGWAMLNRTHVVIEDIYADNRVPHDAYRPTFVRSLLMVPIRTVDPLGAIGIYWAKRHCATEVQTGLVRALADSTAVALEHVERIAQLDRTRVLAETDRLTGVSNRRAWEEALAKALRPGAEPVCVALIEVDRFKDYKDDHGHAAGDRLLRSATGAWRAVLRKKDVLARHGGAKFGVLLPHCDAGQGIRVAERLRSAMPKGATCSIALACWYGDEDGERLLGRTEAALDEAKQEGRARAVLAY